MSTASVVPFVFDGHPIRTQSDPDGTIWFAGADIADCLGYSNTRDAVARHCKEGGVVIRDTPTVSGTQAMTFITEPNVYRLIVKSRLEAAERFERWVFEEVLPQIRRTGRYAPKAPTPDAAHVTITVEEYVALRVRDAELGALRSSLPAAHADHRSHASGARGTYRRNRAVTEGDLDYIKEHWGKRPTLTIAQHLDRSPTFVRHHARRLGLWVADLYLTEGTAAPEGKA